MWNNSTIHLYIRPSIHPLIFFCLSKARLRWQLASQGIRDNLLTTNTPPGGSQGALRPVGICNPSRECWTCPGAFTQMDMLRTQGEASQRHPVQIAKPPHLAPFNTKVRAPLALKLGWATLWRKTDW